MRRPATSVSGGTVATPHRNDSIHVAWLATGQASGGVLKAACTLVEKLVERGHDVSVLHYQAGSLEEELRERGASTHRLSSPSPDFYPGGYLSKLGRVVRTVPKILQSCREVAGRVTELGADVIHLREAQLFPVGAGAGRQADVPCVWQVANTVDPHRRIPVGKIFYNAVASPTSPTVVANSTYTARTVAGWAIDPVVLPEGRPAEEYSPDRVEAVSREDLGLPGDAPVFLSVARLCADKAQDRLLRAFAEVGSSGASPHLLVVGGPTEGAYYERLKAISAHSKLDSRVHFTGWIDDPRPYFAASDVYVSIGRRPEAFGLSVVEAMLMELPVIAQATGGPGETVVDGETGWHTEDESIEGYVTALERALREKKRWGEVGRAARQRALAKYSADVYADSYVEILHERLEKG